MKVIKSLENRGILFKGTAPKINSQRGGFVNFLKPLITVSLPLWTNALISLANMSAVNAAIQKKPYGSGTAALIISNEEMEDIIKVAK